MNRSEIINQAVELLIQAGVKVLIQNSEPELYIVVEDMRVAWSEPDGCKVEVEGVDITDSIRVLNFIVVPGKLPVSLCQFSSKDCVNVNDLEPHKKEKRNNVLAMRTIARGRKRSARTGP